MQIRPKYANGLLELVSYQFGNGLYVGKIVGFEYNKDKKTFFYTIHLMDGDCVNIAEEYIHPLYSYIVVDSETGNIICVFDREQKPFAS